MRAGHGEVSLSEEAARWRRSFRAEQRRHEATADALRTANRMLLGLWLRGRLRDPSDFDHSIGLDTVTDELGRIDWRLVSSRIDQLIDAKPHYAAPAGDASSPAGTRAIEWFSIDQV
ncbi:MULTISPECIES: hypothetical protein [unclassified Rathayibacter]|uniref:hypothetical protein n=1 Tax=unclassified Rathayibacter TaxID=2609250 RepID=UPI00188D1E08|nr:MULTISPECIES: hypothetical protein [unclassified Rathayibacter]MBF4463451.1 hypothetical protein [Rathayibacter sp. VKM Ac-2879]MBF4504826.1 hypothetical protein [Rathayibacter sp. VKM Ac-2878]